MATDSNDSFCDNHQPSSQEDEEVWLLQRDITHALILPVLEIHHNASQLAKRILGNRNIFDLELTFRGEARGAFAWLQCFIAEEEEWCSAEGCPGNQFRATMESRTKANLLCKACVVSYVLQAEPTIRLVLVACRLSHCFRPQRSSNEDQDLPIFDFWLHSLQIALDADPFWGPGFWKDIEGRASALETGIQQLVQQCYELEAVVESDDESELWDNNDDDVMTTKLQTSKIAEKQIALTTEEGSWMQKIVLGCWTTLLADAAKARRVASSSRRAMQPLFRARSLTS